VGFFLSENSPSPKSHRYVSGSESGSTESVRLIDPNKRVVSEVTYKEVIENESYSRNENGEFFWTSPTPGEVNWFFDPELYSSGTVLRVIDGDTLEVDFGHDIRTIRLLGVDAPETKHPDKEPEFYGPESHEFLAGLVSGKELRFEFDTDIFDTYDRLLAYAWLGDELINLTMLEGGYAKLYDRFTFSKMDEFSGAEERARLAELGLFGGRMGEPEAIESAEEIPYEVSYVGSDVEAPDFDYGFYSLLFETNISTRVVTNIRVVDISRLKDGVFGAASSDSCFDVYFDTDKQTSLILRLLYSQSTLFSIHQDCFGEACIMSKIFF
jgi:endonuclease YncB( thermonuclease family)